MCGVVVVLVLFSVVLFVVAVFVVGFLFVCFFTAKQIIEILNLF